MRVRFATPADSPALLGIYGQYIHTPVTFEYSLPTQDEFAGKIADISRHYPYLVAEDDGRTAGYAYAHRFKERAAYQWGAELSVYLDQNAAGRGLGKKLYALLMEILKLQGVRTVYGGVTLPNRASEALHRSLGFEVLGTYHNAGYKNSKWHDVAWFEKQIGEYDLEPKPIIGVNDIPVEDLRRLGLA